ncbi:curli production assembly/transport component CsgF [Spirosoma montaniterrae]|uniref:Curli production assembly/transport component CsgF n=1 Tax=Spirosoma montaniterrae TaxID=1178516 RepID=A0A1P9WZV4_9BACT|nr:curli production assembly/transport component CsgF [Spirosoma montaniterrae]AQG80865.1 curli production assembly protein CsgF [Spirosoma montaniterrae]
MKKLLLSVLLLAGISAFASAQSFTYTPRNPAFGGNTFNYSWLQSSAQAQDRTTDPAQRRNQAASGRTTNSTLDAFSQSIQNQLLSRLTRDLIGNQFGEGELRPGTYRFGDYQVEITNAADGVQVRIVDGRGGETTLTIPYF